MGIDETGVVPERSVRLRLLHKKYREAEETRDRSRTAAYCLPDTQVGFRPTPVGQVVGVGRPVACLSMIRQDTLCSSSSLYAGVILP